MESQALTVTRRLAAILAADAANFSRLVAQDEERTLRVLSGHRALIGQTIRAHGGRIVTTAGDSVLAEFSSPVQAVRAAVEIQRGLAQRNAAAGLATPLQFRIGINVGDVVVDGDDILGDEVNVAVRLESLAPPGGICIAASVREHVAGKLDVRLQDLGVQFLKNIPRPVRAYQVLAEATGSGRRWTAAVPGRTRLALAASATVGLLVLGAWNVFHEKSRTRLPSAASGGGDAVVGPGEYASWENVRQSTDPGELRAFLERYPESTFSELAKARLSGLLAAERRRTEEREAMAKAAEALRAQNEARRLKREAEAAAARAAIEQETAARLEKEAEAAAERAAALARAAAEAQRRLGRAGVALPATSAALPGAGQVTLLPSPGAFDGEWQAEWRCEAWAEGPASTLRLDAEIHRREIRIEAGQNGLPGHFRAYGSIGDDGTFRLDGTHLSRTQRIVGRQESLRATGRIEGDRLEGSGTIGNRRCTVQLTRAPAS